MTLLLRGVADDLALMDWLENYIFPAEVEFVDPEFVRIGTELACWEMIRGGTTTFVDMYYYPDTIAEVSRAAAACARMISATVIDQRSPDAEDAGDSISKGQSGFIERWQDRNDPGSRRSSGRMPITRSMRNNLPQRVRSRHGATACPSASTCFRVAVRTAATAQRQLRHDQHPDLFESIGFFDGPTIAAHVVWPTESEIPILAEARRWASSITRRRT